MSPITITHMIDYSLASRLHSIKTRHNLLIELIHILILWIKAVFHLTEYLFLLYLNFIHQLHQHLTEPLTQEWIITFYYHQIL